MPSNSQAEMEEGLEGPHFSMLNYQLMIHPGEGIDCLLCPVVTPSVPNIQSSGYTDNPH